MSAGNKNNIFEKFGVRRFQTHLDSHAKLKNSLTSVSMKPGNPQRQNQHFGNFSISTPSVFKPRFRAPRLSLTAKVFGGRTSQPRVHISPTISMIQVTWVSGLFQVVPQIKFPLRNFYRQQKQHFRKVGG